MDDGDLEASEFANPYKLPTNFQSLSYSQQMSIGKEILAQYETWLRQKIKEDQNTKENLLKLKGKRIGCWCKPLPCHVDVIIKLINELSEK